MVETLAGVREASDTTWAEVADQLAYGTALRNGGGMNTLNKMELLTAGQDDDTLLAS